MESASNIKCYRFALILGASLLIFSVLGIFASTRPESGVLILFHLDRELNLVTVFSALLLLGNGLTLRRINRDREKPSVTVRFLSFLFLFMAADECLKIHETSEKLTGIDWQLLYLPLIVMAGVGWIHFMSLISIPWKLLWIAGAVAWGSSQLFEAAQWGWSSDIVSNHYQTLMLTEEILEMSGSALFLLVLMGMPAAADKPRPERHQTAPCGRSRSMKIPVR